MQDLLLELLDLLLQLLLLLQDLLDPDLQLLLLLVVRSRLLGEDVLLKLLKYFLR